MSERTSSEAAGNTWVQRELDPLLAELIETLRSRDAQAAANETLVHRPVEKAMKDDRRIDMVIAEEITARYASFDRRRKL